MKQKRGFSFKMSGDNNKSYWENFANQYSIPSLLIIAGLDFVTATPNVTWNVYLGANLFFVAFVVLLYVEFILLNDKTLPKTNTVKFVKIMAVIAASALISLPSTVVGYAFVGLLGMTKFNQFIRKSTEKK
jgi:hypothetical protein